MYLELTDISKKIGADEVLSGITLSMERGKVYGLQGKNGCGKSMLMRVICGLVLPTVGEVKIDGKILGKPADEEDAVSMLKKLQGNSHFVYTGVSLFVRENQAETKQTFFEKTEVVFYPMSEEEIKTYVQSKEPMDKAGAYGIQGSFAAYIDGIEGDYYNVVGLPVSYVYQQLKKR